MALRIVFGSEASEWKVPAKTFQARIPDGPEWRPGCRQGSDASEQYHTIL